LLMSVCGGEAWAGRPFSLKVSPYPIENDRRAKGERGYSVCHFLLDFGDFLLSTEADAEANLHPCPFTAAIKKTLKLAVVTHSYLLLITANLSVFFFMAVSGTGPTEAVRRLLKLTSKSVMLSRNLSSFVYVSGRLNITDLLIVSSRL